MTPHQLQSARRLHHEASSQPPTRLIHVRAGDVINLLNIVWEETKLTDVQGAVKAAEDRLDDLLATDA